jgi:hypothetical protein
MIRLLTAGLLFFSSYSVAEVTLTELNNNTPADANDVMGNFNALKAALPPSDCATDEIIRWDDVNDFWVCADMPNNSPYIWQYKGQVASPILLPEDGVFYSIVYQNGSRELQLSPVNYRNDDIVAPFAYLETALNVDAELCWISLASSTGAVRELQATDVVQLNVSYNGSWVLLLDYGNLTNLTLDATYSLEIIGCL